jgi:predicted RNA binding protein YcfA (HicA-like mRNA interferase family)
MPLLLRRPTARDVLRGLASFGFEVVATRGSHTKLRRLAADGRRETVTVAVHEPLDIGTLRAIYRQALRFIPEEGLRPLFFLQ